MTDDIDFNLVGPAAPLTPTGSDPEPGTGEQVAPSVPSLDALVADGGRRSAPDNGSRQAYSLPRIYSHRLVQEHYEQQKVANMARRQAVEPQTEFGRLAPLQVIEPPIEPDSLTSLLLDAPDFFAIVSRLATDSVGNGWRLVDLEEGAGGPQAPETPTAPSTIPQAAPPPQGQLPLGTVAAPGPTTSAPLVAAAPELGELLPTPPSDPTASAQRQRAAELLESIAGDVTDNRTSLEEMCRADLMDYDSIGLSGTEVAREGTPITGLFHVPGRLIRKRSHNLGWCQVDDFGRQVAYFRNYGSDPADPTSYVTAEEGTRATNQKPGDLKNELYVIRHYHPAELHYGIPPIVPAMHAVMGNMRVAERNLNYFFKRGMPDWMFQILADSTTLMSPTNQPIIEAFVDAIDEHMQFQIQGDDYKSLKVRIPRDLMELKLEKLNSDFNAAEFQAYQEDNRDQQLRVYGMPPALLGIIETANLGSGSGENQVETYKRAQIDPRQRLMEQLFNAVLDSHSLQAVRFKFNEIDILDEQREIGLYNTAATVGDISINEGRAWLSRIVKDQDFPDYDEDQADIPKRVLDQQLGSMMGAGFEPDLLGGAGGTATAGGVGEEPAPTTPGSPFPVRRLAVDPRYRRLHRQLAETLRRRGREAVAQVRNTNGDDSAD